MNFKKLWRFLLRISKFKSWERILLILNFENLIFQKMQFSCSAWEISNLIFENEISPDAVNFGQFATNRRDLDFKKLWRKEFLENFKIQKLWRILLSQKALRISKFKKLWRFLLRISKFKSWERISKFKKLWRFLLRISKFKSWERILQ